MIHFTSKNRKLQSKLKSISQAYDEQSSKMAKMGERITELTRKLQRYEASEDVKQCDESVDEIIKFMESKGWIVQDKDMTVSNQTLPELCLRAVYGKFTGV